MTFESRETFEALSQTAEGKANRKHKKRLTECEPLTAWLGWVLRASGHSRAVYEASAARARELFGNPFRPISFSSSWRTDTAVLLARQMYDSRDFSAMPILADALQDAGCDNDDILSHCRDATRAHVRGCWVIDLPRAGQGVKNRGFSAGGLPSWPCGCDNTPRDCGSPAAVLVLPTPRCPFAPTQGDMFVTHPFRTFVGCAALIAGLWIAGSPDAPAGTPDLPKDSYKKAADADLKFLQTRLDDLAKAEEPLPRSAKPALAATLILAVYADVLGDAAFKADVLKVGEAVNAKDFKGAAALAKKLTIKPGAGKAGGDLPKFAPYEKDKIDKDVTYLPTTMKLFSNTQVLKTPSGLNIEKDLKDWTAKGSTVKLDLAAVELLAVRSAIINEFAFHNPNEKARNKPANEKEWKDLSKQSVDLSKEIILEATKKTPDLKVLRTKLTLLEGACTNCHGKYRFDD